MVADLVPFVGQAKVSFSPYAMSRTHLWKLSKCGPPLALSKYQTIKAMAALTSEWFNDSPAQIVVAFNSMLAMFALL